jgi:hypothetical protein
MLALDNKSLKLSRGYRLGRVAALVYRLWRGEANCAQLSSMLARILAAMIVLGC